MNALFLPQQVTQNVTPPPHSATVWADINGKLWFQLPNQAPVQINTGNNALVPSNAQIQPPQAFVNAMNSAFVLNGALYFQLSFNFYDCDIVSIDQAFLDAIAQSWSAVSGQTFNVIFRDNALNVATVNQILASFASQSNDSQNGTLDLSGGTNAKPTGQGLIDKATLIGNGWTVTTNP